MGVTSKKDSLMNKTYETKYSRMDQVKIVESSL